MVATNQDDFAIQPINVFIWIRSYSEVAEVVYCVRWTNSAIPTPNKLFVHFLGVREGSLTIVDDVGMAEVGIGRKENAHSVSSCNVSFISSSASFSRFLLVNVRCLSHQGHDPWFRHVLSNALERRYGCRRSFPDSIALSRLIVD
jgi:hypothetical protein